jgi:hypothetical protein
VDVDQPVSIEEIAEAAARDEIVSLLGPAVLHDFTVRARRDPDTRDLLHVTVVYKLTLRYEQEQQVATTLLLGDPVVLRDPAGAVRAAVRPLMARLGLCDGPEETREA